MTELREDREDMQRELVQVNPSGDLYIADCCSLWDEDHCVGSRFLLVCGPINRRDLGVDGPLDPTMDLHDAINAIVKRDGMSNEDATWLQEQEDAGHTSYPVGV